MKLELNPNEVCRIIEDYLEKNKILFEGQVDFYPEESDVVFYFYGLPGHLLERKD